MAGKPKTFEEKWADPSYDWRNESANPADAEVQSAKALLAAVRARRPEESATGVIKPPTAMARVRSGLQSVLEPLKPLLPAWEIAKTAALPAAFMGAGPAAAAAGIYGAQGGYDVTDPSMSNPMRALTMGAAALPLLPKALGAARSALGAAREIPKTATPALEVLTERAAQFDDVAARMPKADAIPHTFDMTGAARPRMPATNTAVDLPYTSPNAGGRLGAGTTLESEVDDALLDFAKKNPVQDAVDSLNAARVPRPAPSTAAEREWFTPEAQRFRRQMQSFGEVPDYRQLDAVSETVAAPGFGLGPITPLDQIPTSKAAQSAAMLRQLQQQAAEKAAAQAAKVARPAPQPWIEELTDADIAAAMENGYQYGQGIPASVNRRW